VVVITGPGRSGTSALAQLYRDLGFDPGGGWVKRANAGFEHPEIRAINHALIIGMGGTQMRPREGDIAIPEKVEYPLGRRLWRAFLRRIAWIFDPDHPRYYRVPSYGTNRIRLIDWDRLDIVLDVYGDHMRETAAPLQVVKDPRFCVTLPIWLAAGVEIEYVVITARAMGEMVNSRYEADHTDFTPIELRNTLYYRTGVAISTAIGENIPHTVLRFPDFLHDLDGLYDVLRFPAPVDRETFRAAAARVFDVSKVRSTPGHHQVAGADVVEPEDIGEEGWDDDSGSLPGEELERPQP
jgi:hypothetical protein